MKKYVISGCLVKKHTGFLELEKSAVSGLSDFGEGKEASSVL